MRASIRIKANKPRKEKFLLRIIKGAFVPADSYTHDRLRAKKYHNGDVVSVAITKPRNPKYHRLAHAFGRLVVENVEAFHGLDAHTAIKRLQLEANVACEIIALNFPGIGPCEYRVPRSLSFADMDQGEFEEFYRSICRYAAKVYWPGLTPEQIEEMTEVMADE